MVKIGLICWKQGGGTNDYLPKTPMKPWKKGLEVKKGEYKGKIPFEKALMKALEYHHNDVEIMFINKFDEKLLLQNDVNFLVSLNLLNFNNSDTANCVSNSCMRISDSASEPADSWFYVERTGALSALT